MRLKGRKVRGVRVGRDKRSDSERKRTTRWREVIVVVVLVVVVVG